MTGSPGSGSRPADYRPSSPENAELSVLFVCLGNICRSPTAEAVFRKVLEDAGMAHLVYVDSAGTGSWHVGKPADPRASRAAAARGLDMSSLRARQVTPADMDRFDLVVAMDAANVAALERLAPGRAARLLEFAPDVRVEDVPDPYFGGEDGFDEVLDLIEVAALGLLAEVQSRLTQRPSRGE